jgi:rubrerythrin
MDAIDRFAESYLAQWERASTVRSTKRYALTRDIAGEHLFPARLQPLCDAPAVAALGPEGRRYVLIQTCLRFMNETVLLETDVVARLAADLANRPHRVALSEPVRQVALTIAVDEAYHAFAAREFIGQIREVSGIEPVDPQTVCGLALALEATMRVTTEERRDDLRVAALCIAENSITAEILGMTEETPADNPFHIVAAEHLVDERRHSGYFQHVLKHYWAGLDEAAREALGAIVPIFLEHYLVTDIQTAPSVTMLRAAGVEAAAAERTVRDTLRPTVRSEHRMARNVMRLLDQSGLLAHPPTREALVRAEWIAA